MGQDKFYTVLNGKVTELSTTDIAFLLEYRMSSPEVKEKVVSITKKYISEKTQKLPQE